MNNKDLHEIIIRVLTEAVPGIDVSDLEPDDNLRESLDIDSFDNLNFLVGLHEKLGVDIPEKDYGKLNTLNEIIHYLAEHKTV